MGPVFGSEELSNFALGGEWAGGEAGEEVDFSCWHWWQRE